MREKRLLEAIKEKMTSDSVALRIITTYVIFLITFSAVTILSYYLLPQGILANKHPLQGWNTSPSLLISTFQIFFFNMISVIVILTANTFLIRRDTSQHFMPLGYFTFFVLIVINAVVLGTWSFSMAQEAVPLLGRLVGTFDILHRAGLWEMSGQLFILCATIGLSLIVCDGKVTTKRSWRTVKLTKQEIIAAGIGLAFMLTGALIESYSIILQLG